MQQHHLRIWIVAAAFAALSVMGIRAEESSQIGDYTDESDERLLEDEAYEREDVVEDDASRETGDEQAIELDRETPIDGGEQADESETRPTEASCKRVAGAGRNEAEEAPVDAGIDV